MQQPIADPHLAALRCLSDALRELGTESVLIGGVAVSLLAQARYTRDVDILVILDTSDAGKLINVAQRHQFAPLFSDAAEFAVAARIAPLTHISTGITVDVALGCMPFEAEVIARAQPFPGNDIHIGLPTPEDLLILKAIAGRPKDLEDIRNIALTYPDMDRNRVERWVREYGELLEDPELWHRTLSLLGG